MAAAEERDRSWEHLNMGLRVEVSSAGDHSTPWSSEIDLFMHFQTFGQPFPLAQSPSYSWYAYRDRLLPRPCYGLVEKKTQRERCEARMFEQVLTR